MLRIVPPRLLVPLVSPGVVVAGPDSDDEQGQRGGGPQGVDGVVRR
jgi:hypothetical protein